MRRDSYIFSAVLHVVVALLAIFGLPMFWQQPPIEDQPIVVDVVPLGAKTNPPPLKSAESQPEPPKPQAKPEPPKPEPRTLRYIAEVRYETMDASTATKN